MSACPCSIPKPKGTPGARRSEMEQAGPTGCRRCRGTSRARHCHSCAGTGVVRLPGPLVADMTCLECIGVGYFPADSYKAVTR